MKRVLTAAWLIPFGTYSIFYANERLFVAIVAMLALFCYRELARMIEGHGFQAWPWMGVVLGLGLLVAPEPGWTVLPLLPVVGLGLGLRAADFKIGFASAGAYTLGILYVFGAWRCGIGLHAISAHWLFFAAALNWAGDVAAYYTGRRLGRRKLAPSISPGKTVEGAIGGVCASVLFGCLYLPRVLPEVSLGEAAGLALAGSVAGQIGDLCESALKRGAGLKDSGAMLAGHGGWLDRLDSSLFSMPVVYWALMTLRHWS
ncbi:MAG: phosphatidate cytidylyltransferase [Bryobacter sp.]|jgi:phosphatidate cytidylyltransferase|nr:phosphatidate cytidylyltransferase [Bryobacter sp. CoA8 C33]